jgi:hypothetical protein
MQTKPKSNSAIVTTVDAEGRLVFEVIGAGVLKFDPKKAAGECRAKAERHGWFQRISDAAAMSRTDDEGNIIPRSDIAKAKLAAMTKVAAHYETGTTEWSRVAEGGPRGGILFRALSRMYADKTADQVHAFIAGLSKKQQAALRASPKVAAVIRDMESETVKDSTIDADALLAQIES